MCSSDLFIACRLLDHSHPDWREMVPHCGFDLHFSDNDAFSYFDIRITPKLVLHITHEISGKKVILILYFWKNM